MLTSLRIQNFRSIRDASVKLGQVNLFIGPNNSGKSNFLKGVELLLKTLQSVPHWQDMNDGEFEAQLRRQEYSIDLARASILLDATFIIDNANYPLPIVFSKTSKPNERNRYGTERFWDDSSLDAIAFYKMKWRQAVLYKLDPSKFQGGVPITDESNVSGDGANLVSFIFYLSQNHKSRFRQLEKDLESCVVNLVSISTPADPGEPGKLKLKFFDQNDIGYWAEEVSEGVLYFLALLCIVHQPDPPKLLLLEEPEKGIHPRRIKEVMDFIFELARLRDIQIILTSHSPYVVDYFADIPECISVFDRDRTTSETVIHNAGDLIDQSNAANDAKGLPRISYTDALGEYWVSGFLGGVPA